MATFFRIPGLNYKSSATSELPPARQLPLLAATLSCDDLASSAAGTPESLSEHSSLPTLSHIPGLNSQTSHGGCPIISIYSHDRSLYNIQKEDFTDFVSPLQVAAGSNSAPLPPSVEEAYRRKCIELKRRMCEVEESNDAFRLRKVRLNRGIRKMRLERAYLLETLSKRMRKNGSSVDGVTGFYDEESEGSSEGPPTPNERPLRSKRSHRRPLTPPAQAIDYQISQHQSYQHPSFEHHHAAEHESPYSSAGPSNPINGLSGLAQYPHPQHLPIQQPPVLPSNHSATPRARQQQQQQQQLQQQNSMISPIPAPSAFAMFFENDYLSQPHKYPGARTEEDLHRLAAMQWDEPQFAAQRSMFEAQEEKQKMRYEENLKRYEMAQQSSAQEQERVIKPKVESEEANRDAYDVEKQKEREEKPDEDVEMGNSGRATVGGFTSING